MIIMKKNIFFVCALLTFLLCSCSGNKTLTYDKDNPQDITLEFSYKVTTIRLYCADLSKDITLTIDNNLVLLPTTTLNDFRKGNYTLEVYGNGKEVYMLTVEGILRDVPSIEEKDILGKEDTYFVYFFQDDCPYCERIKPYINEYYDFSRCFKDDMIYTFNATSSHFGSDDENILNVTSLEELRISAYPLLIEVNKNKIVDFYKGEKAITTFLSLYMD